MLHYMNHLKFKMSLSLIKNSKFPLFLIFKFESSLNKKRSTEQLLKLYCILLAVFFNTDILKLHFIFLSVLFTNSNLPFDSISRPDLNFFSDSKFKICFAPEVNKTQSIQCVPASKNIPPPDFFMSDLKLSNL